MGFFPRKLLFGNSALRLQKQPLHHREIKDKVQAALRVRLLAQGDPIIHALSDSISDVLEMTFIKSLEPPQANYVFHKPSSANGVTVLLYTIQSKLLSSGSIS